MCSVGPNSALVGHVPIGQTTYDAELLWALNTMLGRALHIPQQRQLRAWKVSMRHLASAQSMPGQIALRSYPSAPQASVGHLQEAHMILKQNLVCVFFLQSESWVPF